MWRILPWGNLSLFISHLVPAVAVMWKVASPCFGCPDVASPDLCRGQAPTLDNPFLFCASVSSCSKSVHGNYSCLIYKNSERVCNNMVFCHGICLSYLSNNRILRSQLLSNRSLLNFQIALCLRRHRVKLHSPASFGPLPPLFYSLHKEEDRNKLNR